MEADGFAPVSFVDDLHHEVHEFLVREAEILDERRHRDWLDLLTDDIRYRMPVRITTAGGLDGSYLGGMDHFSEDLYSLRKRIERLETEYAWTEDPPSRVRHIVTNVRAYRHAGGEVRARSYLLLFRSRGDVREADILVAERRDGLRRIGSELRLHEREIRVDESVLRTQNLAVLL